MMLSHYTTQSNTILKVYYGEEAWKQVVLIRYGPSVRKLIRRLWQHESKAGAILIIFIKDNQIHYRYYLHQDDEDFENEGETNMFDTFSVNDPFLPGQLKKLVNR